MAKATQTPAKKPAIDATIVMPEGWDSEDHEKQSATWSNVAIPLGKLQLDFANNAQIVLDAGQLSHDVLAQALMHGLKQKLVDAAAISRNPEDGKSATLEVKFQAIKEVADRLLAGEWNKRREGGANAGGLLKRALLEMYAGRKTEAQIETYLNGLSDKDKAALRKNSRVAEIIERLRREDAEKRGEEPGKDLLAELDALEETQDDQDGE